MSEENGTSDQKQLPPLTEDEIAAINSSDAKSDAEVFQLGSGAPLDEIKRVAEENEANRTENFRNHFEKLALWTLYLVWGSLAIIGILWLYHLIAPPCWPRLPDEQVRQLASIVTGGALASIAGGHLKRRLQ